MTSFTHKGLLILFAANRIHISESSYKKLRRTGNFKIQNRGAINVKVKL